MPMVSDLLFRTVDGAFAVDAQQRVAFWNRGCEQLLKRPAKDALGRRCCEVLRGCNSAGEAVCRSHCQMAELAGGGPSPGSFALSVEDGDGATQRLNVSIVLMPSPSKGQWTVLHMLHRAAAVTSLDMLHGASQAGKRRAGNLRVDGDGDMDAYKDADKDADKDDAKKKDKP